MSRLWPCLTLAEDETLTGYVSRLAHLHRVDPVADFCREMGFAANRFAACYPPALARISDITATPVRVLADKGFMRTGDGLVFRRQTVNTRVLRRNKPQACPACFLEDMGGAPTGQLHLLRERCEWKLLCMQTCVVHRIPLVDLTEGGGARPEHEFVRTAASWLDRLHGLAAAAEREPSGLEVYAHNRLAGLAGDDWLDALPMHAAIRTCEMLGASILFGRSAAPSRFRSDDWWRVGEAGHAVACLGVDAIRRHLTELQTTFRRKTGKAKTQASLGLIHRWLDAAKDQSAYDPVRRIVVDHMVDTTPIGPGDVILGIPVERRRLHSITSASTQYGLYPDWLRGVLVATGRVAPGQERVPGHSVTLTAEAEDEMLSDLSTSMTRVDAESYLNAGRMGMDALLRHGLIEPILQGASRKKQIFAKRTLDGFLDALLGRAEPGPGDTKGLAGVALAAKRAKTTAGRILQLVLARRVRVWKAADVSGYAAVRVDVQEVRRQVVGDALPGLPNHRIQVELKSTHRVVTALIDLEILPSVMAKHPVNGCPVRVVPFEALRTFQKSYVSVAGISRERDVHPSLVLRVVREAGLVPAFDHKKVHARFYRRQDIEPLAFDVAMEPA